MPVLGLALSSAIFAMQSPHFTICYSYGGLNNIKRGMAECVLQFNKTKGQPGGPPAESRLLAPWMQSHPASLRSKFGKLEMIALAHAYETAHWCWYVQTTFLVQTEPYPMGLDPMDPRWRTNTTA